MRARGTTPVGEAQPLAGAAPASGLSTFLITDIEGSTRLWETHGPVMGAALAQHDRILRAAIEGARGTVIKTTGDGMLAIFDDAATAIAASLAAQRALRDASWGETGPLRVRMALHSGTAESRDGDYFGPALNRSARLLAIGHGGQVLASAVAAVLARDGLAAGVELRDLGSHRLRDLDRPEQVFQVEVADLPRDFPALRSLSTRRSNLPVQLTSFIGRERELDELADLVARHRLVTLVGTGGTGKTRLMLEGAARVAARFPDGVWLAELAPLGDPMQIAAEVARALAVPLPPGRPAIDGVMEFLADKELLLLLDNAEHLVDGAAGCAEQVLSAAPGVRMVATSREALAVPGEVILPVRSLGVPAAPGPQIGLAGMADPDIAAVADTEAVRLFAERARAVLPGFEVTPANASAVAEICRRLDGIPLAIELAAARVSSLSITDIESRLGDRFRLLTGGRRTAVPRQQTLHALIDWSWDLLTDDDRRLLRRLSVFVGGWLAEAARAVVGDDGPMDPVDFADGLARLVDRSLVVVDRGAATRYRMLETIRQYAREKLIDAGEAAPVSDRHAATFLDLAVRSGPELKGPAIGDWLDRLDAELDNLGAALEWSLEAHPWTGVAMAEAMLGYWGLRVVPSEFVDRITRAVEIARTRIADPAASIDDRILAARLLGEAGRVWAFEGRPQIGRVWATEAVAIARATGDRRALLAALFGFSAACAFTGDGATMGPIFREAFELAGELGDTYIQARVGGFGGAVIWTEHRDEGRALVTAGVAAADRSSSPYVKGWLSMARGQLDSREHPEVDSTRTFRDALARFQESGDRWMALVARSELAHAHRRGGRHAEAAAAYRETILDWVRIGHRGAVANQLECLGFVARASGDPARAARLLGAAEALREAIDSPMAFDEEHVYASELALLRDALPADELAAAWATGRALSLADAVALAVAA
jgi:predicted ATPase/class 3 adenylate cyclase